MTLGTVVVLVITLAAALTVGELVHHTRGRSADEDHGGFHLDLLAGSTLTLAVITCSFMLAASYGHYDDDRREASDEAGALTAFYQAASLLPDPTTAQTLQQDAICYSRAIATDEWPRLGLGDASTSPRVDGWRLAIQRDLRGADPGSALSDVRAADQARTETRHVRLIGSVPEVPVPLLLLLVAVSAAAVFFVSAYTVQSIPRRVRLPLVAMFTVLLGAMLVVIVDLDHPYAGLSRVTSADMAEVATTSTANYAALWPGSTVTACDADGVATP